MQQLSRASIVVSAIVALALPSPVRGAGPQEPGAAPQLAAGPGRIEWNGTSSYWYGVNFAWWNYGTDFGTGAWGKYTDWEQIGRQMQRMADAGAKVARWWVFADGRYSPEFNRDGTVSGLDASFLPDIDRALRRADAAGIRLILTVIDGSMWKSAVRGGSLQFGGRSKMVTDPAVRQTFLDRALRPLVEHVAASPYRDRVIAYDIVNEPEAQMRGYWGGVNLDPSLVKEFVRKCAETIHSHGGGALATVGSAMPWYAPTWKGLGLDFYQVHYYPWMDPGLPGSGLPVLSRLELDKPCIVGEFPTNCRSYEIGGATAYGAQWYLDKIASRGYAGALAWSFWIDDTATDWRSFKPVFASWAVSFEPIVGPG